ncbi:MAG: hypothetical protein MZW92_22270 [Comamonadaceae bacterium]|nr:hypothetical protein [Comamonadaceae bacterium]
MRTALLSHAATCAPALADRPLGRRRRWSVRMAGRTTAAPRGARRRSTARSCRCGGAAGAAASRRWRELLATRRPARAAPVRLPRRPTPRWCGA